MTKHFDGSQVKHIVFFSNYPGHNSKCDSLAEAPIGFSLVINTYILCDMFSWDKDLHTFLEHLQNVA